MTAVAEQADSTGTRAAPPTRTGRRSRTALRLLSYVAILVAWQLLSTFVAGHILPPPLTVAASMFEIARSGELVRHFSSTLVRALLSLGILYVLGVAVGIVMGLSRWWEAFFRNWVTLVLSMPGILVVLIVLLVFGLNPVGPIVAIVLVNFAFVTVQVWEGVKSLPDDLMAMSTAFQVPRPRVLRQVVVPALAPFLFTALTYGFALTWKITMLTELFGSSSGVGYMFRVNFGLFSVAGLLAWALWSFGLFLFLERVVLQRQAARFFRWRAASFD